MRILVTGGTGLVGAATVRELLAQGHRVRLLSRHAEEDVKKFDGDVEPVSGSVADSEDMAGVAEACDVVIHNAGVVAESEGATFDNVSVGGTRNMLHEAERAGVRRFIYVSSLGADRGTSSYHKSKISAEKLVQKYPREWVITRPAIVFGPGDEVVSLLIKMVRSLPAIPVIAGGGQLSQPIWVDDCAKALADCLVRPDILHKTLLLAGDERVSMNEMLDRLTTILGKNPVRVPMPGWIAEQGAQFLSGLGVDLPFGVDQITMLQEGNMIYTGEANALTEIFGIHPAPLDQRLMELTQSIPVRLPTEGIGPMMVRTFRRDIADSLMNAESLFGAFVQNFTSYFAETPIESTPEPVSTGLVHEGATLTLALPVRGNVQVRVAELTDTSMTLLTVQGHPLAGAVRFSASDLANCVSFSVETFDRPANLADAATMLIAGRAAQGFTWETVLDGVVQTSGGYAPNETVRTERTLKGDEAKSIEDWAEKLALKVDHGARLI